MWSSKRGPNPGCQVQEYCNCPCADGYLDRKLIDGTGRFVYHQNRLGSSRQAPWRRGSCYRHHGSHEGSSLRLYTWSYDSMTAGLESTGSTWRKVVFSIDWPQGKPPLQHTDLLLAHRPIWPVLAQHEKHVQLWKFHRRWERDESGHQFQFSFYSSARQLARFTTPCSLTSTTWNSNMPGELEPATMRPSAPGLRTSAQPTGHRRSEGHGPISSWVLAECGSL